MKNQRNIIDQEKQYWTTRTEFEWLSENGIQAVLKLIPPLSGDVLELCSGSGMFTRYLQGAARTFTCLDLSKPLLETLKKNLPGVIIIEGNAEAPSLPDESVDVVLVFAGLHHLPNLTKTLQNAYKLLRDNGKFIAFEPNKDCWYRLFMLPLRNLLKIYTEDETFISPRLLFSALEALQFEDITIDYITPEYNVSRLNMLNKVLAIGVKNASSFIPGRMGQSFFVISGKKKGDSE